MTSGTVPRLPFWTMLSPMKPETASPPANTGRAGRPSAGRPSAGRPSAGRPYNARPLTWEQGLLNVSGLLAIGLGALASGLHNDLWPGLAVYLAFTLCFIVGAFEGVLRLHPLQGVAAVLCMAVLSVLALLMFRNTLVLILSVVLMASAPYHLSGRQSWLLMAVVNLMYWLALQEAAGFKDFGLSWLSLVALQGFAITSSLARQREIETREILARQHSELLAARALMAQQTQAEERLRIAGDLHDTIGHRLTALQLQLEALAHQAPEDLRDQVITSQGLASDLLEDIRAIVRRMSEEKRGNLADAIRQLGKLTPGVEISITSPLPELDTGLAQQLVFCFQEAIHNAIRHGQASRIDIRYEDEGFTVLDNGRGLRGRTLNGFGLNNIGQRLAPFAGTVTLRNGDQGGCELRLSLPGLAG